jgi:hypothetical protein
MKNVFCTTWEKKFMSFGDQPSHATCPHQYVHNVYVEREKEEERKGTKALYTPFESYASRARCLG